MTRFGREGIHCSYAFYVPGLSTNVPSTVVDAGNRAVGCDLSTRWKRRQSSPSGSPWHPRAQPATTIGGSFLVIEGEYSAPFRDDAAPGYD
jgi:hypothetical protein